MLLFEAYFNSKIQNGIELYGNASNKLINKLQIKQNRAIKTLFNLDFLTPTVKMHKDFKILMIKDKYKLNITKFAYKQQNNMLPEPFQNHFTQIKNNHSYKTRANENILIHNCKTEIGKRATTYLGANQWNSLPLQIRKSKSLKIFSKKTVEHLLNKY
jgi:hypothetical protein